MNGHRLALLPVLLLLTLAAGVYLLPRGDAEAQEEVDISGEWTLTLEGDITTGCSATFGQTGSDMTAEIDCRRFPPWTLTGSVDQLSDTFSLRTSIFSVRVILEGSAAAGSDQIDGTWAIGRDLAGVFAGVPGTVAPEPPADAPVVNLVGDWNFTIALLRDVTTGEPLVCPGGVQQAGTEVYIAFGCGGGGGNAVRGLIDPDTNRVILLGTFIGVPVVFDGVASADGTSLEGEAVALDLVTSGVVASRKDRSPEFIDLTGSWDIELELLDPEPGVPNFSDNCSATFQQRLGMLSATLDCEVLDTTTFSGTAHPISRELFIGSTIEEMGGVYIGTATPGGNFILGIWSDHTRDLEGSFRATRTSGPFGDVNCDATVNSIDAAILLQFNAGLVLSLACPDFADMNASGDYTSIDAALILQRIAGLI